MLSHSYCTPTANDREADFADETQLGRFVDIKKGSINKCVDDCRFVSVMLYF